jgi:hypothetical protein
MSKLVGSGRLGGYEHTQEYIFFGKIWKRLEKVIHIRAAVAKGQIPQFPQGGDVSGGGGADGDHRNPPWYEKRPRGNGGVWI